MTVAWVELSGENLPLARAELAGVLESLRAPPAEPPLPETQGAVMPLDLPEPKLALTIADRLAFGWRVLLPWPADPGGELAREVRAAGADGRSASFRPLRGDGNSPPDAELRTLAAAYKAGGGRIELETPERRFWAVPTGGGAWRLAEEVASVDRAAYEARRMPRLPFQRPVSLPPRRARTAVNLGAIRPGDRVLDPFVGTGALLLEAALVGARVSGIDIDPEMVRGTLRNLGAFGVHAELLTVADAGVPFGPPGGGLWDAIVTDPPYGRASTTGGEAAPDLVGRVLPAWTPFLAPDARVSLVVPGGPDPLGRPWERVVSVPDRVHRSLTREFRVYRRSSVPIPP